jgi:hypothetical protein
MLMAYSPNERGGPASLEQSTSTPFSNKTLINSTSLATIRQSKIVKFPSHNFLGKKI